MSARACSVETPSAFSLSARSSGGSGIGLSPPVTMLIGLFLYSLKASSYAAIAPFLSPACAATSPRLTLASYVVPPAKTYARSTKGFVGCAPSTTRLASPCAQIYSLSASLTACFSLVFSHGFCWSGVRWKNVFSLESNWSRARQQRSTDGRSGGL